MLFRSITFTRIRPYRKNDNCFVEQKNYTVVRRFLGYARYDTDKQLIIIKEILKLVEVYVNFFQPVMKLKSKQRIGTHVKKTYDTAKTPYQRLLESGVLVEDTGLYFLKISHLQPHHILKVLDDH